MTAKAAKRVNIVSCKLVRECPAIHYANRRISTPEDVVDLIGPFLEDKDREEMIAIYLDR